MSDGEFRYYGIIGEAFQPMKPEDVTDFMMTYHNDPAHRHCMEHQSPASECGCEIEVFTRETLAEVLNEENQISFEAEKRSRLQELRASEWNQE